MKRLICMLMLVGILLCACNAAPVETNAPTTTEATTEATTETTTEATTVPTEPPVLYRHPLTGAPLEEPFTGRVTAVVINNIKAALPQYGITGADIFYELETEGGITRCLGLFTDLESVGTIGPIRSARTYFNNIAASYDAPVIHCGGSDKALAGMYDESGYVDNWEHINEQSNGKYFFRDYNRYNNQGYNWEHTLFTDGEKLLEGLANKEMNTVNEEGTDFGLLFDEEVVPEGTDAKEITVEFRGDKTTEFTYEEETGLYKARQYGSTFIDAGNNQQLAVNNLLVIHAEQTSRNTGYTVRSYYDMVGSGTGYFATAGKIMNIKWTRENVEDPFSYTYADGTPVTLNVGKTYVGVIDLSANVFFE